jgi:hypothetical protein
MIPHLVLEATLIKPRASAPSLERPRLMIDGGDILPALYHYAVRIQRSTHYVEMIVPAQHEIDAAKSALAKEEYFRKAAIEEGSVTVYGVDERGRLGEYPVTIRISEDGKVAIPP